MRVPRGQLPAAVVHQLGEGQRREEFEIGRGAHGQPERGGVGGIPAREEQTVAVYADSGTGAGGEFETVTVLAVQRPADERDRIAVGVRDGAGDFAATGEILQRHQRVQLALPSAPPQLRSDVTEQLAGLVYPGFIAATAEPHWSRLSRYLHAIELRLASARANPVRDRAGAEVIDQLEDEYAALCARYPAGSLPGDVAEVGWLLEELRVSLFAQTLGTAAPVSAKRIRTAMAAVRPPSTLAQ